MNKPPEIVHHYYTPVKSAGTAALLEVLGGLFLQTFGIGHLYVGNVALGLFIMLGYWLLQAINAGLCFIGVGLITLPLTWLIAIIASPLLAAHAADGD